ncbi:MAG: NAD(P)H-binding protein [Phycisphaerales bacterium]|nr:NAD(P)H-binding protein [Phycisphaerales bacterium]
MGSAGTVAVTGATGFVGRHTIAELLARGRRVRALVRDPEKAARVLPPGEGLELVEGDIFDEGALARLLTGSVAAVNTIGIIREGPGGQLFERVHVLAVRMLLAAMRGVKCDRLVHVSALGVSDNGKTGYARSKFAGEQAIRASGVRWTILRPGLIHGPGGEFTQMCADWARGRIAPFLFMPYFARTKGVMPLPPFESPRVQPVFVGDVARAIAESLEREAAVGEVYPLTGAETVTWPELLEFFRDHVSLAKPGIRARPIPAEFAALKARAIGMLGLGALLPFDEGMARMGAKDSTAPTVKAREHLGMEFVGFREAAAGYLGGM